MKVIFTTESDLSAGLFEEHGWEICLYSAETLPEKEYDFVYLRDPFNTGEAVATYAEQITKIIHKYPRAKFIDNITSFEDIYNAEDKWQQALLYGDLAPKTYLATTKDFIRGEHLAKPRVSQRAKNILFELDRELDDGWIIQELLDIKEELRVYVVFGRVVPKATIKSSKASGKVKVIGGRDLSPREITLCEEIAEKSTLDFIGIDLAVLNGGELSCIEVNRSPQFVRFVDIYGEEPLAGILDYGV